MPSQLLHFLFGEDVAGEVCRRLESGSAFKAGEVREKIQNTHKNAFALGCQGPDIFYHSRGRRPVGLEYGTLLHRRGAGNFTAQLLTLGLPDNPNDQEEKISDKGIYALGFMTHAILDRQAHPYIVYRSCGLSNKTLGYAQAHAFFERIIDVLMLKILRNADIACWDQDGILAKTCENPPSGLKELLARCLVLAFPERAGKDEKLAQRIENTFLDCVGFYRFTAPFFTMGETTANLPSFRREQLCYIYPAELPVDIDFLNLGHGPWYYPAGEDKEDFRSFPEIYADAVKAAADSFTPVISKYLETGFFPATEAALAIGNGGLSITDETGAPCAPRRTSPFPLDRVLG